MAGFECQPKSFENFFAGCGDSPAFRDVLDLRDRMQGLARSIAPQRNIELHPDDLPVLPHVTFFDLVRVALAVEQMVKMEGIGRAVVRMSDGGKIAHDEFVSRIAD